LMAIRRESSTAGEHRCFDPYFIGQVRCSVRRAT
jgi:hypothetical protein